MEQKLQQIRAVFPEDITHVHLIESGWMNLVIEINDRWIFRFPRKEDSREQMEVEKTFLQAFRAVSPVRLPHFVYQTDAFVGYEKIQGELFSPQHLANLSAPQTEKIAQTLANFLHCLHTFSFADERVRQWRFNGDGRDFYEVVLPVVLPQLSASVAAKVRAYFDAFAADEANFTFTKGLVHGDLRAEHMIFDPSAGAIVGIIDFGDLSHGDLALDFAGIAHDLGADFLQQVLSFYPGGTDDHLRTRIDFHAKKCPVTALFHAQQSDHRPPEEQAEIVQEITNTFLHL